MFKNYFKIAWRNIKLHKAYSGINIFGLAIGFVGLTLVAYIIAFPVAWYVMNQWLQDFAYRVNINWWVFVAAGVLVFSDCSGAL